MRCASSAPVTGRVVSTNHSSGLAFAGGCSSRACTTHTSIGAAPGHGSATGSWRSVISARRAGRLGFLACLLALARALCRLTSTVQAPRTRALRIVSNRRRETWLPSSSVSCPRTRSTLARTSNSTVGACSRRSTNRSRKSASRSMAHTTRVSGSSRAASAQSRNPSIQRNDLRASRGLHAVFEKEKRPAGPGAGQYRGPDRGQVFVSRTPGNPYTRHPHQCFMDMGGPDFLERFGIDQGRAAGCAHLVAE